MQLANWQNGQSRGGEETACGPDGPCELAALSSAYLQLIERREGALIFRGCIGGVRDCSGSRGHSGLRK